MSKILFVDNSIVEFYNFRGFVAEEFNKLGYKVALLVPNCANEVYVKKLKDIGVCIYFYNMPKKISLLGDLKLIISFYKYYKKIDPNLIIHYTIKPNIYGSFAAFLAKVESISLIPGLGSTFQTNSNLKKIVSLLYRYALKHPRKIWVLNKDDYQTLIVDKIAKSEKIEILPGEGIDINKFNLDHTDNSEKSDCFCFLFIGRLIKEKGVEYLVNAAEMLYKNNPEKFKVIFLGSLDGGLSSGSLSKSQIDEWNKKPYLEFKGRVSDVREYIKRCDVVILPSFYGEGLPRSLMEGAAMGKALITTDNVGCREVVIDGYNGFLVAPENLDSLYSAMSKSLTLSNSQLLDLGYNGRMLMINKYSKDIVIKRYLKAIDKLEKL